MNTPEQGKTFVYTRELHGLMEEKGDFVLSRANTFLERDPRALNLFDAINNLCPVVQEMSALGVSVYKELDSLVSITPDETRALIRWFSPYYR